MGCVILIISSNIFQEMKNQEKTLKTEVFIFQDDLNFLGILNQTLEKSMTKYMHRDELTLFIK